MSTDAILRAIDVEFKSKCRAAQAAYEKRVKPARKWVAEARAQLKRKEEALVSHQALAAEEQRALCTEAQLWRDEAVRAVKGDRPFKISDVPVIQREVDDPIRGRSKISLPRLACLGDRS